MAGRIVRGREVTDKKLGLCRSPHRGVCPTAIARSDRPRSMAGIAQGTAGKARAKDSLRGRDSSKVGGALSPQTVFLP